MSGVLRKITIPKGVKANVQTSGNPQGYYLIIGNGSPNSDGSFTYNVYCDPYLTNTDPVSLAQQIACCTGDITQTTGLSCNNFQPDSANCAGVMYAALNTAINGSGPGDPNLTSQNTANAIAVGSAYLQSVDPSSSNITPFISNIWNNYWVNRQIPGTTDWDTYTNLTSQDMQNVGNLLNWCSLGNGTACSSFMRRTDSANNPIGICNSGGGDQTLPGVTLSDLQPTPYPTDATSLTNLLTLNRMCGCNMAPNTSNYPLLNTLGVNCSATCAVPGTIQSTTPCTSNVCVIDDFSINLANSKLSGGVSITQICGENSKCYFDGNSIDSLNSQLTGGVTINQQCGSCYNPVTNAQISCITGQPCSGEDCGGTATSSTSSKIKSYIDNNPAMFVAIGVVVLAVIVILIVWALEEE